MAATDETTETPILIETDERGVATVTINRPKVRNAINDEVIHLLTDALLSLGVDATTRIVVLTGSGAAFSAGADLDWMRRMAACSEMKILRAPKQSAR